MIQLNVGQNSVFLVCYNTLFYFIARDFVLQVGPYSIPTPFSATGSFIGEIVLTRPSGQRCVLKYFWAYPLTEMREMRGGNLSTVIATFGGSRPGDSRCGPREKLLLWAPRRPPPQSSPQQNF